MTITTHCNICNEYMSNYEYLNESTGEYDRELWEEECCSKECLEKQKEKNE